MKKTSLPKKFAICDSTSVSGAQYMNGCASAYMCIVLVLSPEPLVLQHIRVFFSGR